MSIKKYLVGAIFAALLSIGITANAEVTSIQPDKNIGVYTDNQTVSFTVTRDSASAKERFTYSVENINSREVRRGSFTMKPDVSQFTVTPGNFTPGWYRLKLYNGSNEEIGIFASFTVVDPMAVKPASSPFSAMLYGFSGLNAEQVAEYAEALGLIGVDTVRDGTSWGYNEQTSINKTVDPFNENDLKPLLTYAVPSEYEVDHERSYKGNLYKTNAMLRSQSNVYLGKVSAYEVVNEPDLVANQANLSADVFSSFYKAAALGIEGGNPNALKSFGGLSDSAGDFAELMMQNDVADYVDSFNIHMHSVARNNSTAQTINYGASRVKNLKNLAAIYGNNKPLWNTEAGLSTPVDANDLLTNEYLRIQAKYAITSTVQSIANYGAGNHVWFVVKNYIENGKNWGSTSPEHCTYPAFYSLSMLTRGLGEGTPIGEIKGKSNNVSGYFFDAGDHDAAVLWSNSATRSYQQIRTTQPLKVMNLIGGTEKIYGTTGNETINVPVTSDPIIIIFNGRADSKNYIKKAFTSTYERSIVRTAGDKVVAQVLWDDTTLTASNGRYVLSPGETYDLTVKVYNFNEEAVSGSLTITPDAGMEIVGTATKEFSLPARTDQEFATLTYTVTVKSDAANQYKGSLGFSGTAGGSDISDTVCGYVVEHELTRENIGTITNFSTYNLWKNGNMTLGTGSVSGNQFTFTPNSGSTSSSWFPVLNDTIPTDSNGLVFDVNATSVGTNTKMRIYVYVDGGVYTTTLSPNMAVGTQSYIVPWEKFYVQNGDGLPGAIDLTQITKVEVGFQTRSDDQVRYTISNAGTYKLTSGGNTGGQTVSMFSGLTDHGVYKEGKRAKLTITGAFDHIYVNYEDFDGFTRTEDGAYINLLDLEPGAYSVIVTKDGDFGKKEYEEITFCIKAADDFTADATFY